MTTFKPTQTVRILDLDMNFLFFCPCTGSEMQTLEGSYERRPHSPNCPSCDTAPEVTMSLFGSGTIAKDERIEYVKLYDNGHLISIAYGIGDYTYNPEVQKVGYRKNRYRITFNATTGNLYFLTKGKVRNITYALAEGLHDVSTMLRVINREYNDLVTQFIELCAERRGLQHIDMDRLGAGDFHADFAQILKFPALENFPTYRLGAIPKSLRKPLAEAQKLTELYELFIGTSAKSIRKYLKSGNDFAFYDSISSYISETSNISKILKAETTLGSAFGQTPLFVNGAPNVPVRSFKEEAHFMMNEFCNGDETVFVNRILSERVQNAIGDLVAVSPQRLIHLFVDIKRMYEQMKEQVEDFEISYRGSFTVMHDRLSTELNRLRFGNKLIPYKEEEITRYNRAIDDIEFRLAETTERLRDIGRKTNICVGSYADWATSRNTTIIEAYYEGHYAICLEVIDGKLIQAKTPYNRTPNPELRDIVKKWAYMAEVKTDDCGDVECTTDEALEQVLRQPAALEDILNLSNAGEGIHPYQQPVFVAPRVIADPADLPF